MSEFAELHDHREVSYDVIDSVLADSSLNSVLLAPGSRTTVDQYRGRVAMVVEEHLQ